jgi:hypothetical protein
MIWKVPNRGKKPGLIPSLIANASKNKKAIQEQEYMMLYKNPFG